MLSINSKKVCKIYIYNVLAHPANKNQNNLKVVTTTVIGICKMVNVSHDPLSIESSQKTTPTIQKHSLKCFMVFKPILLNSLVLWDQNGEVSIGNSFHLHFGPCQRYGRIEYGHVVWGTLYIAG